MPSIASYRVFSSAGLEHYLDRVGVTGSNPVIPTSKSTDQVLFSFSEQPMADATFWIQKLGLSPHPEGGFFRETYRAAGSIPGSVLPSCDHSDRSFSTAIYFLLRSGDRSVFHRIKSDEIWHYHAGASLTIYALDNSNGLKTFVLGDPSLHDSNFQVVVPAGCWFAAEVNEPGAYVLAGCTVAPGFDFQDFEIADKQQLLEEFPGFGDIIDKLGR